MSRIVTDRVALDDAVDWPGRLRDRESGKVMVVP
jgi:hypothetical protein